MKKSLAVAHAMSQRMSKSSTSESPKLAAMPMKSRSIADDMRAKKKSRRKADTRIKSKKADSMVMMAKGGMIDEEDEDYGADRPSGIESTSEKDFYDMNVDSADNDEYYDIDEVADEADTDRISNAHGDEETDNSLAAKIRAKNRSGKKI